MPHTVSLSRTALLLAAAALALAGCADSPGSPDASETPASSGALTPASPQASPASPSPAASGAADAAAATSLAVEFSADGQVPTDTWTLECDGATPAGTSDAPDPAAACAALAEGGAALMDETGTDMSCTMQIAGMQRARVSGTVAGEAVETEFALTDGCQISRWEPLTGLLGPASGAL